MLKFHKIFCFVLFLLSIESIAQQKADIAIQQGHSDEITTIVVSKDNKFFATFGKDSKLVIWDSKSNNQFSSIQLNQSVDEISFGNRSTDLFIKADTRKIRLDIKNMTLSYSNEKDINYKQKKVSIGKTIIAKIDGPNIRLISLTTGKVIKSATSDYYDQPFTSVIISDENKKIFASSIDGKVYEYNFELKLLSQWHEHNWYVNDLALTEDEKYLFSVSSDRSIIKWNISTSTMEARMSSKSYPTYGVSYYNNQLCFGDQIGHLKTVKLDNSRLDFQGVREANHPILFTYILKDSSLIYSGANNEIKFDFKDGNSTTLKLTKRGYANVKHTISEKLGFYKPPFSGINSIDVSPNEQFLVYSTNITSKKLNYIKIIDIRNREKIKTSKKLFLKDEIVAKDILFLNDSIFISSSEKYGVNVWRINNGKMNDISIKHIPLNNVKINGENNQIVKFNNETIAYLSGKQLFFYNLNSQRIISIDVENKESIYSYRKNAIILSDNNGSFSNVTLNGKGIKLSEPFTGHSEPITSVGYSGEKHQIFTSSKDGSIRIWNEIKQSQTLIIIPIGLNQSIYLTEDSYYMINDTKLNNFGFRVEDNYYYPEQFDPVFNRPDIILDRLGYADSSLVDAYHQAYLKRLKKMGFTEDMLKDDFHLPELQIENFEELPAINDGTNIELNLKLKDTKYKLDRINVWVNDVAIYGSNGISLRDKNVQDYSTILSVNLAKGNNKIQVSVLNQAGAESYKESFEIECTVGKTKPDLYLITIGDSKFKDADYNLTYAAKDATDMANMFSKSKVYENVNTKVLVNNKVTKENVLGLRSFLEGAEINDQVMIFIAGHGVLDENLDYFFATYDMDFNNPSDKGLAYEDLEGLLDGISPLKKILLIDACHSGEIEKEEVKLMAQETSKMDNIQFRAVGKTVAPKLGMQNTSELTKSLFTDLRKGTGATVISSAGGMEFAMESDNWNNGLFTYCLLNGLESKSADLNKDGKIWLSELQKYVQSEVNRLSEGKQQPTSRIENNTLDYRVW